MPDGRFISYLRVSTQRQGKSGLGLEAQRQAVDDYLNGGQWEHLAEFVEVESGKTGERPELKRALHRCQVTGATLIIAKLDRLTRSVETLVDIQRSGVEFIAADNPEANSLTINLLVSVGQYEREMISKRTKEALAAAKRRGVKLGNPKGAAHLKGIGNDAAVKTIKTKANAHAERLRPILEDVLAAGVTGLRGIAGELNRQGVLTPRGGQWHPASVSRTLKRLGMA